MNKKKYNYYDRLLRSTTAAGVTVVRRKRKAQNSDDELQLGLGSPMAKGLAGRQAPKIPLVFEIL